jgi:hypothetical protein
MTDSTMVEKVARAIRIARTGPEVPGWSWADVEENKRAEYRGYARAAIEAISAPTPSMLRAGLTAMSRDDLEPTEAEFVAGYTAAIRDALGETFGAITGITPGFTVEQVEAINRRPTSESDTVAASRPHGKAG